MALKLKKGASICRSSIFISYWNTVIKQWISNQFSCSELKEQTQFANDLRIDTESIHNRLPEPYWGDPEDCSFAMMNYNPGPCNDSRHNYRFCANTRNCMIKEISANNYSSFAKSFPLLRKLSPTESWFEDSIGRIWWQEQKEKWIDDFLVMIKSDKLPFALELCAWHSDHWYGINHNNFKKHQKLINDSILEVFKEAISQSDLKIGLCFGKRIGNELLDRDKQFKQIGVKGSNYKVYTFNQTSQTYHIINYWDNNNHRNRYPKNPQDLIMIINKFRYLP